MSIVVVPKKAAVMSLQKSSILEDLKFLREKVHKALQGDMKFMDADLKKVTAAIHKLDEAMGLLDLGLLPTNNEAGHVR